jgi:hypothetical protein
MCYPPPVTGSRRRPPAASQRACRPRGRPPHAVQLSEHGRDRRRPSGRAPESPASRVVRAGARRARGPGRPAVRGRASGTVLFLRSSWPAWCGLQRSCLGGAWRRAGRRRGEARPGRRPATHGEERVWARARGGRAPGQRGRWARPGGALRARRRAVARGTPPATGEDGEAAGAGRRGWPVMWGAGGLCREDFSFFFI